jgi:hypothetical protein
MEYNSWAATRGHLASVVDGCLTTMSKLLFFRRYTPRLIYAFFSSSCRRHIVLFVMNRSSENQVQKKKKESTRTRHANAMQDYRTLVEVERTVHARRHATSFAATRFWYTRPPRVWYVDTIVYPRLTDNARQPCGAHRAVKRSRLEKGNGAFDKSNVLT